MIKHRWFSSLDRAHNARLDYKIYGHRAGVEFLAIKQRFGGTLRDSWFGQFRSNRALITIPALGVLAAGFILLALSPTLIGILVADTLIGIEVGGSNPPLMTHLGAVSSADDVGKLVGFYNVFGDLGSTLGPNVALPLVARVGFTAEFLAIAVLSLGAAVIVSRTLLGNVNPADAIPTDE